VTASTRKTSRLRDDSSSSPSLPNLATPSLSTRAFDALVQAIVRGAFRDGRLPAENVLADQLGVSRTTVRSALQSLEQVGIIERRPGRGTRIRKHAGPDVLILHGLVAFSTLLRERGHEVESIVTMHRNDKCPDDVAARLSCDRDQEYYEIDIRLYADGQPAVHIREQFPDEVLGVPLDERDVPDSVLKLSTTHFKVPIDHAVATLHPRLATGRERETIGLEPGQPFLFMEEFLYAADEGALVLSEISVNSAFVQYAVMRQRP
jgi:GntR family transcriptional regulator